MQKLHFNFTGLIRVTLMCISLMTITACNSTDKDTKTPVINLLGANPATVILGTAFSDPGSSVTDDNDTNLIATVTGNVDIYTLGSYTLMYNVNDSSGNAAIQVTRQVDVIAEDMTVTVLGLNNAGVSGVWVRVS